MRKPFALTLFAALALCTAGAAWSQEAPLPKESADGVDTFIVPPPIDASLLSGLDLKALEATMQTLQQRFAGMEQRVQAGMAPQSDLDEARLALTIVKGQLDKARVSFAQTDRLDKLANPVDVQLKDASIQQTAKALSSVSGVPVTVAPGISTKTRVTLDAKRVPLSSVLEAVARQADLIISPDDKGVTLEPRPSLTVNGSRLPQTPWVFPWSPKWPRLPGGAHGSPVYPLNPGDFDTLKLSPSVTNGLPMISSLLGSTGEGRVAVTSVQNHVVLAEPGVNEKGEQGTWLTIYRMDGDKLVESGSVFHKARAAQVTARATIVMPKKQ